MTWHAVEIPDAVIKTPLEVVREQSGGFFPGGTEIAASSNGKERHIIDIIVCYFIDDGQLPSAYASPLGPEDHVDGLDLLAENELAGWLKCKRELSRGRTFGQRLRLRRCR